MIRREFILPMKSVLYFAIYLLIAISLFNTSQFGTSFSWIVAPTVLSLVAVIVGKMHLRLSLQYYLVFLFWIICVLSTFLSPVVEVQRDILSFALFILLYTFMTAIERDADRSRKVVCVYIFVAVLGCLVIIYNYLNGIYYNSWFQRSTLTFHGVSRDPNYVAGFIAPMPILVLTYKPLNYYKSIGIIKTILIILGLVALIIDGSRGGIISAAIPLLLYILLKEKSLKKRAVEIILLITICILGYKTMVEYLPAQTVSRLLFQTSGDTRSQLWKAALSPLYNNPIIGQGIGSASYYSRQLLGNYSHNMYLDILGSSGILGAGVYLLFLLENLKSGKRLRDSLRNNVGLIYFSFLLPQLFLNGFNTVSMWLPLIMIHHVNTYYMYSNKEGSINE